VQTVELPAGFHLKHPVLEDADAIAAVMCQVDLAEIGQAETNADDVRDEWALPRFDVSRDAWIVVADGGAIHGYGFVWDKVPDHEMIGDLYVLPGATHEAIAAVLCARIEEVKIKQLLPSHSVRLV